MESDKKKLLESDEEQLLESYEEQLLESYEEIPLESHPFECHLEKADDLCEIGYEFQRNEIIYEKIAEKAWIAEISIPDDDEFEIGFELEIENYIYKKIDEKLWTIMKYD